MDPLAQDVNQGWASEPSPAPSSPPPHVTQQPQTPQTASSTYIRDPQVYGDPGTSLMSPTSHSSGGERPAPFLRIRIAALERNRKDLLVRFDASTNLPNFRTSLYRNMQRSYVEFQRFAEQLQLCCPHTIVPALPLPHTSAATDEEDDRIVRIVLQRWFSRVCDDPELQKEDELRSFIESDFGYNPIPPPSTRKQTTGAAATQVFTAALSKVVRRSQLDDDDEIGSARITLERLEPAWATAANSIASLSKARKTLASATSDVGAKLIGLATDESDMNLATAERKMGRTYEQLAGMAGSQITSDNVVLNDSLAYQSANAKAARDALAQRTQILEDSHAATKNAISRRRNVERLKGSSSINPHKVDDAIAEMEEADAIESRLTTHLNAISSNLHTALRTHSRNVHEDVAVSLLEHARLSIIFNRQVLRELEALKPDFARVAAIGAPSSNVKPTTPIANPAASPLGQPSLTANALGNTTNDPSSAVRQPQAQSMFLPPPANDITRSHSADIRSSTPGTPGTPGSGVDQLGGAPMAQSMMLPGQRPPPRQQARRLDERKAAKLLAGGF